MPRWRRKHAIAAGGIGDSQPRRAYRRGRPVRLNRRPKLNLACPSGHRQVSAMKYSGKTRGGGRGSLRRRMVYAAPAGLFGHQLDRSGQAQRHQLREWPPFGTFGQQGRNRRNCPCDLPPLWMRADPLRLVSSMDQSRGAGAEGLIPFSPGNGYFHHYRDSTEGRYPLRGRLSG